jgi:predicted lipoprotein with Yx(FWY)xxD motif
VAARFYGSPHHEYADGGDSPIPHATPPGITLQLRGSQKYARVAKAAEWVYADSQGMSLYAYAKDPPRGPPVCTGECARAWPPARASPGAQADGAWSPLTRADGIRQWTLHGAPLYRYGNDKAIGDAAGDGAEGGAWHVAVFRPGDGMALPAGIAVSEIADAGGAGLVDARGMTLYAFDGDAEHANSVCGGCARSWIPLEAPQIASAAGNFSLIARPDGITQWSFHGKPLYKFDGDRNPGDTNGIGVDSRFRTALIVRFFMPSNAAIRRSIGLGTILVTRGGATLYQRDRVTTEELHQFRSDHGPPALGRALGTSACDSECTKTWPPFAAPANALPSGYWDVVKRDDGARQWAFKGFALYTYAADKPGDLMGNGIYTLAAVGSNATHEAAADPRVREAAGEGVGAMFWHAVVP